MRRSTSNANPAARETWKGLSVSPATAWAAPGKTPAPIPNLEPARADPARLTSYPDTPADAGVALPVVRYTLPAHDLGRHIPPIATSTLEISLML